APLGAGAAAAGARVASRDSSSRAVSGALGRAGPATHAGGRSGSGVAHSASGAALARSLDRQLRRPPGHLAGGRDAGAVERYPVRRRRGNARMMRSLFLHPPSYEGFDGGAGSRYQARREVRSFWYPTWLAQPAALVSDSKLVDAPAAGLSLDDVLA